MTRDEIKVKLQQIITEASRNVKPGQQKALDALATVQELADNLNVANEQELIQIEQFIELAPMLANKLETVR